MSARPKKSRGGAGKSRPKRGASKGSLIVVAAIAVAVMGLSWGLRRLSSAGSDEGSSLPPAAEGAAAGGEGAVWPPPPGTPRETLFADHPGETIVPATAATATFPFRRRFCDPWYRLSNPRVLPVAPRSVAISSKSEFAPRARKIAIDVEVVTPAAKGVVVLFQVYAAKERGGSEVLPLGRQFPMIHSDLQKVLVKGGKGTATVTIDGLGPKEAEALDGIEIEIFLTTSADEYEFRREIIGPGYRYGGGGTRFKVSPSVFLGAVPHPHPPRDWTAEETAALTGPPGAFSFTFNAE